MRAVALLVVCVWVAGTAAAETREIKKDYDETFQVSEGAMLELHTGDGDVTIAPWDRDEIRVVVHYDATVNIGGAWKQQPDFDVDFEHAGNIVRVVAHEPSASWGFGWVRRTIRKHIYEVSAPSWMRLNVNGDDGDVTVTGLRGDVELALDDGDVQMTDIECDRVDISLDDGDVRLIGFRAALHITSDDGDVDIEDWVCPTVRIALEDGDVMLARGVGDVNVALDDGDLRIERLDAKSLPAAGADGDMFIEFVRDGVVDLDVTTDDGDIDLKLHPNISAMLAVAMDDGDVSISHTGLSSIEKSRHRFAGTFGAGEGSVRVRTADGDIDIREMK